MADGITVTITGIPVLDKKLAELEAKLQRKVLLQAAKRAAEPVLQSAQSLVPIRKRSDGTSGLLFNSLKIVTRSSKHRVGVRVQEGGKGFTGPTFYGSMVEFGHRMGKRPVEVKRLKGAAGRAFKKKDYALSLALHEKAQAMDKRSQVDAHPYMARAADANRAVVVEVFKSELAANIQKAIDG